MLFKSALLTTGSGKIKGIVASHNRGGQYFRGLTIPTNPNTAQQQVVRDALKSLVGFWQNTLTAVQRTTWQTYADNVPVRNALGDAINLTGQNMYIRSNVSRQQASLPRIDAAPVTYDLGSFTAPTLTLQSGTNAGTLTWTGTDAWTAGGTNSCLLVYQSRQQARSINFFAGPYQFAGKVSGTSGTASLTMPFTNANSSTQTFFKVTLSQADGRLSSPFLGVVQP